VNVQLSSCNASDNICCDFDDDDVDRQCESKKQEESCADMFTDVYPPDKFNADVDCSYHAHTTLPVQELFVELDIPPPLPSSLPPGGNQPSESLTAVCSENDLINVLSSNDIGSAVKSTEIGTAVISTDIRTAVISTDIGTAVISTDNGTATTSTYIGTATTSTDIGTARTSTEFISADSKKMNKVSDIRDHSVMLMQQSIQSETAVINTVSMIPKVIKHSREDLDKVKFVAFPIELKHEELTGIKPKRSNSDVQIDSDREMTRKKNIVCKLDDLGHASMNNISQAFEVNRHLSSESERLKQDDLSVMSAIDVGQLDLSINQDPVKVSTVSEMQKHVESPLVRSGRADKVVKRRRHKTHHMKYKASSTSTSSSSTTTSEVGDVLMIYIYIFITRAL